MKKLLIGLGILVLVVIVAVVAVPFVVPVSVYKGRIVERVKAATGRDLRIDGPMTLSLVPRLALEASDVALANAPGGAAKDMVTIKKLDVALKLLPLLHGAVEIDRFVLVDPVIALEVGKDGRRNWVFAKPAAAPSAPAPGRAPAPPAAAEDGLSSLAGLRLADVRLVDGTLSYLDQRSGKAQEVSKVNMTLSLPDPASPFVANGSAVWQGEAVTLALDLAKPGDLAGGKASPLSVKLASRPIGFDFKGEAAGTAPLRLTGSASLAVPSVRDLAKWLGRPIAMAGSGLGPLAIDGKVDLAGPRLAFTDAALSLDAIKARGDLALDTGGARPYAKGRLDVDKLDLNPYLPPERAADPPAQAAPAQPATGQPAKADAGGWSDQPLDLHALGAADADFSLSAGALAYRKLTIGKSALTLHLKDGRLVAELGEMALYKGKGQGRVTLDGTGVPAVETSLELAGVDAQPLLRDLAGFDRLTGIAAFDLDAAGRGPSQRAIIGSLAGKGDLHFTNGALQGVDLLALVRDALRGAGQTQTQGQTQGQTGFTELTGTFTIDKGILRNDDLAMQGPVLSAKGAGTVDLPNRRVDFRLTPQLAAGGTGQGGLAVPVLVTGPWDDLSYRPDLAGLIQQSPGKVLKDLKRQKPADILKGLLGK